MTRFSINDEDLSEFVTNVSYSPGLLRKHRVETYDATEWVSELRGPGHITVTGRLSESRPFMVLNAALGVELTIRTPDESFSGLLQSFDSSTAIFLINEQGGS